MKNITVLYIESDRVCRNENSALMRELGLNVLEAENLESTNELLRHSKIDLILIDIDLHQQEGITFIQFLRYKDIIAPVIITADSVEKETLLDAINLDTSRFLIKPLKKDELINAVKIAVKKMFPPLPETILYADLGHGYAYDPINKSISSPDLQWIRLTKKEYLLLELLMKRKNQIVVFDEIEDVVWSDGSMGIDSLRTLVRAIRKKSYPEIISNYSGIGYKLNTEPTIH